MSKLESEVIYHFMTPSTHTICKLTQYTELPISVRRRKGTISQQNHGPNRSSEESCQAGACGCLACFWRVKKSVQGSHPTQFHYQGNPRGVACQAIFSRKSSRNIASLTRRRGSANDREAFPVPRQQLPGMTCITPQVFLWVLNPGFGSCYPDLFLDAL